MIDRSKNDDEQLIERIREHLDAGVDELDGETLSRLAEARRQAVAAAGRPRRRWTILRPGDDHGAADWLVPAGAFASVVATVLALTIMVADSGNGLAKEVEDLEMLTAGEEIELYENLEFYLWLQDRESTG
jgi:hypothetical protein